MPNFSVAYFLPNFVVLLENRWRFFFGFFIDLILPVAFLSLLHLLPFLIFFFSFMSFFSSLIPVFFVSLHHILDAEASPQSSPSVRPSHLQHSMVSHHFDLLLSIIANFSFIFFIFHFLSHCPRSGDLALHHHLSDIFRASL